MHERVKVMLGFQREI